MCVKINVDVFERVKGRWLVFFGTSAWRSCPEQEGLKVNYISCPSQNKCQTLMDAGTLALASPQLLYQPNLYIQDSELDTQP